MKQAKRTRIGALAQSLEVERFVIRFWEKEFSIKSRRSEGGQRWYTKKDVDRFCLIKDLLYKKKFTIAGAKQYLKSSNSTSPESIIPSIVMPTQESQKSSKQLILKLESIKEQLMQLQQSLEL
ncbi:MerR family transcriptional regulator [bacterium]|nr:MerR family transcriptional regulator [bacterium]MBT3903532.1 MerR family transcriptional regulator [bacterium]MBT4578029.1 MerR family transcriptional regulator [bacterium]MBT5346128.1 MerR family transcriptional regulator [bacterium]MBT6131397.1 MerR family transcriptional regulator [bacterium]